MEIPSDKTLEELFKFQLAKLKLDFEQTTGTVSQTVRTAAFGLAALALPLITVAPENVSVVVKHNPYWVESAAALGILAVILDVLQNLLAARIAREDLSGIIVKLKSSDLLIKSPAEFMPLPQNTIVDISILGFYYLKIGATAVGLFIVIALILIDAPTNRSPATSVPVVIPSPIPPQNPADSRNVVPRIERPAIPKN